ncbi:MAG: LiaI-LiaF-like domain-containing protein [bacterium]
MAKGEKSLIPGVLLIIVGVFFLLNQLDLFYFRWRHFYPIILLGLGALFFISIFTKNEKGSAFPATIFLVLGFFFLLRNFGYFSFDYYFYDFRELWPIFLIAFGLGFIVLYFFKSDDWGVLIPGSILLFFGVVFFLRTMEIFYWRNLADFWPIILIAIGLSIVINSLWRKAD